MRQEGRSLFIKSFLAWCTVISSGLLAAFITYLSLISLWIGLTNLEQRGSWVPILMGTVLMALIFNLYSRATRAILSHIREEGLITSIH